MTASCIVIVAGKLFFDHVPRRNDEAYIFGGFTLVVVVLSGLVTWCCLAYRWRGETADSAAQTVF